MYSDALSGIVRKVASVAGMELVIPKGSVNFNDEMIDITERVIDDIQKNPPVRQFPAVPNLGLPKPELESRPIASK